jgi:hypothetical protein
MALDDHEQKILAEIERRSTKKILSWLAVGRSPPSRIGVRLAMLGVVAGLAIVIGFFASNTVVAFLGFGLLVGSAAALVTGLRSRAWRATESEPQGEEHGPGWQDPFRRD